MAQLFVVGKIPMFDIGTVLASAYVGYNNSKGIDVGPLGDGLKYGPTIAASIIVSTGMLFGKFKLRKLSDSCMSINQGSVSICENPVVKAFSFKNIRKETAKTGIKTGLESIIGYGVGYSFGKLS